VERIPRRARAGRPGSRQGKRLVAAAERYDISGKVVLITGAARGIGAEAARQLYAKGAQVSLVGIEPELLEQRAKELGSRAAWFEADVTDVDALRQAVDATVERFGGIDVLIANAGIAPIGTVATIDPEAFERTIEINLLGVWRTVRAALPHVVERRGYVLPIASLAAAMHMPLMAHYAATKAGVEAFSDCLRGEVRHTGTKVGVAYFSFIDTDMTRESIDESPAKLLRESTPGPVSGVASVESAGRAIVRAIERRARKAYAPRWVPIPLALRGMLQPLIEKQNHAAIEEAVKLAEAEAAQARPVAR
jgi:NAD(P)-dependent dehydrogenase (short-subunit alcohol dehydrogenase family)